MHHINSINGLTPFRTLRLESIVLGEVTRKLISNKKLQPTREFASWTKMNLGLLSTMEKVGYMVELGNDVSTDIKSWNVTRRYNTFELATSFLVANGLVDKNEVAHLITERAPMLTDLVPMMVRKAIDAGKLTIETGLSFLETINLFNSNLSRPVPGTWLETYCRENPSAPVCLVATAGFHGTEVLRERTNLGFIALCEHYKLIDPTEAVSLLKSFYGDLGGIEMDVDMTVGQAEIILDTAGLGEHLPTIRHLLADARAGYVVDGVWAEMCQKNPTPQLCTLIHQMPIGRAVVDALVTHKMVEKTFIKSLVDTMVGSVIAQ